MAEPAKPPNRIAKFFATLLRGVLGLVLVVVAAVAAWKLAFDLPTLRLGGRAGPSDGTGAGPGASRPLAVDHAAEVAKFAAGQLSRRDRVKFAQAMLQDLAYDPGPIDGLMGAKTLAAVRDFQTSQGAVATGTVDRNLIEALAGAVIARGKDPMAILKATKQRGAAAGKGS